MSKNIDSIKNNFSQIGIENEQTDIYLEILQNGKTTALKLARTFTIPRTSVYRILDSLLEKGLVIASLGNRGTEYSATAPSNLQLLIDRKEAELTRQKQVIAELQLSLSELEIKKRNNNQVFYYHGIEGLKQVTYNSLHATGELCTYELETMNAFLSFEEAEKYRERFIDRKVKIRTLTNAKEIKPWTEKTEMVKYYWEIRHLSPLQNPFRFEILLYNDIYAMYKYVDNDIFCIEIQSQELADMQKQLFEYLWRNATPFTIHNLRGEASIS